MSDCSAGNELILIDNGMGSLKAGFAGDDVPRIIIPAVVGIKEDGKRDEGKDHSFVGYSALEMADSLDLDYPIKHGIVSNWDDMEKIWHHAIYNELQVNPEEFSILLTEEPLNPKGNREKMSHLMFETFQTPAMYIANSSVLSMYASGRCDGLMVSSGDDVTSCTCIYDGHAIPQSIRRLDIAGRNLADYLAELLADRGYSFSSTAERGLVQEIKAKMCFVAEDYTKETTNIWTSYTLPGGHVITLGDERGMARLVP